MYSMHTYRTYQCFRNYGCTDPNCSYNIFIQIAMYFFHEFVVIFNVFDLECNKNLQFYELILMFKSVIRGFSFLTGQRAPENVLLEKYARALFSRADLNNDQIL